MGDLSLKAKLVLFCLCLGVLPLTVMGIQGVHSASSSLSRQSFEHLESVRDAKKAAMDELSAKWFAEVKMYASVKEVFSSIAMLADYFMGKAKPGEKMDVDTPEFEDSYQFVAPAFAPFIEVLGYQDALLIDEYGRVLFSAKKGREMGEDVNKGALASSNLGQAWSRAIKGETVLVDFAPYPPLDGRPAAFVASPVRNHVGGIDGVAVFRLAPEDMAPIMSQRSGMGRTGESYLVGQDGLMRSDSFRDPQAHTVATSFADPQKGRAITAPVSKALEGESGAMLAKDFRGQDVLAAYTPVTAGDVTWALVAEIDQAEAFAPVGRLELAAAVTGVLAALVIAFLAINFLRREILDPFAGMQVFLHNLSQGNFRAMLLGRYKAEMGDLAHGLYKMVLQLKNKLGFSGGILSAMTAACVVVDTEGRLSFVNQRLLDLMELPGIPDDYMGQEVGEFFAGTPMGDLMGDCAECESGLRHGEYPAKGRRGRDIFVRQDVALLHDLDGRLLGTFSLFADLTEIKLQEAQIRSKHEMITQVAEQADDISDRVSQSAEQLAGQAAHITYGAGQQTERLREATQSMEQMNTTLMTMAQSAEQAAGSAEAAKSRAMEGSQVVERSVAAIEELVGLSTTLRDNMHRLGTEAKSIGNIITVIEDIADQTNLLALNAAIEAARAGEHGRGFAVVADEVRKLAEKTMSATRQVSDTVVSIQDASERNLKSTDKAFEAIGAASDLVKRSGESLGRIVELCMAAASQVTAIANSAQDQSSAHDLVHGVVAEVGHIAEDTAHAMNETAEAVNYLAEQAGHLKRLIEAMRREDYTEEAQTGGYALQALSGKLM